jgi:hypothetical protein
MNSWSNIILEGGILSCKSIFLYFYSFSGFIKLLSQFYKIWHKICDFCANFLHILIFHFHDYLVKSFEGPQRIPGRLLWKLLILIQTVIYRCMLCRLLSLKLYGNLCSPVALNKHGEANKDLFSSSLSVPSWRVPYFKYNCMKQFSLQQAKRNPYEWQNVPWPEKQRTSRML